jgi:hypothetical protein
MFHQPIFRVIIFISVLVVIGFIYLAWADGVFDSWRRFIGSFGTIAVIIGLIILSQHFSKNKNQ